MKNQIYNNISCAITNKITFIDIDGTFIINPSDPPNFANQVIDELRKQGYLCIINTSRTQEMCMSSAQYLLSKTKYSFSRPPPKLKINKDKKYYYVKPENFLPINILDLPIIISSSGTQISVKQKGGGYAIDQDFYPTKFSSPSSWRKKTIDLLSSLRIPFEYAPIESESSYLQGKTDIFPADYRIQLLFHSQKDLIFLSSIIKKSKNLYFTNDSNPDKNIFTGYITLKNGKIDAVNHVMKNLTYKLNNIFKILIIGDSLPDFESAIKIKAYPKAKITLFLVGGSRLSSYILNKEKNDFAGVDLPSIKQNITLSHIKGQYVYTDPKTSYKRSLIIGNEAFSYAVGPMSIVEFLQKKTIIKEVG